MRVVIKHDTVAFVMKRSEAETLRYLSAWAKILARKVKEIERECADESDYSEEEMISLLRDLYSTEGEIIK